MNDKATSQGMPVATRNWVRYGADSLLEHLDREYIKTHSKKKKHLTVKICRTKLKFYLQDTL